MTEDDLNNFSEYTKKIISFTKDQQLRGTLEEVIGNYSTTDEAHKNLSNAILESLQWIAQRTHSTEDVQTAAKIFILDSVKNIFLKYTDDIADQIITSVQYCVEDSLDKNNVERYVAWMNNGQVRKLLDFAASLNGNGNVKLKRNILSILFVNWNKIDDFNEYAAKIANKKISLEKKVEFYSILRDIINSDKKQYAEILVKSGLSGVSETVQNDLSGLKTPKYISSIRDAIRFVEDKEKDTNVNFLFQKNKEFGSIRKWFVNNPATTAVIEELKKIGIDTDFFVASGVTIAQKRSEGHYSDNWTESLTSIVLKLIGSKKNGTLPRISIPNIAPSSLYKKIADDYQKSLTGDKDSAKRVLKEIKLAMLKNFSNRKIPQSAIELLSDIEMLVKVLDYGGTLSFRGAKVVAKVWKRKIPNDLYDSENIWCCLFFPDNEYGEIQLIMMDPKTSLIQFFTEGLQEPVACAFAYAGISEGKPTIFVDTVELGALAYAALGQDKMKEFVYKSILKFTRKSGAKRVIFFANPEYGRSVEFCNYLHDFGLNKREVSFESVDSEDSVLKEFSKSNRHHYTDAFQLNPMKGTIEAFVFDV